jgi:hypothetical protein
MGQRVVVVVVVTHTHTHTHQKKGKEKYEIVFMGLTLKAIVRQIKKNKYNRALFVCLFAHLSGKK